MSSNDPLIGKQLANFRVERVLGRGGMALVYYGHDVKLQRPVAIKAIDARFRGDASFANRFVSEARSVATWRHENIMQVYYADNQDDLYYFVMEYIDGPDLGDVLHEYAEAGELMPHEDVLRIGKAVGSAIDYAHGKGVVHRDIKPANVMMATDGRIVLTDFGLALDVAQGSMGEVMGTPHYVAPEQARRSADAVPQSDIYALGVMLYEMLTGAVPFDDPSPASLALQHLTLPPPPPRGLNPELSEAIEAVLLKSLEKKPEDRYQSGNQLMEALNAAFKSAPAPGESEAELPPLPPGITPPRKVSRMTVSEKVADYIKASETVAKYHDPMVPETQRNLAAADREAVRKSQPRQPAAPAGEGGSNTLLLALGGAAALAAIAVIIVVVLLGGGGDDADGALAAAPTETAEALGTAFSITETAAAGAVILPTDTVEASVTAPTNTEPPTDAPASATPRPAATDAPATATSIPASATFTLAPPTATSIPPTATFTLVPPTPTATIIVPSNTPQPTAPPQPTVLYPNGRQVSLLYNASSFYLWNPNDSFRVAPLSFAAVDVNGNPTGFSFDGAEWTLGFHSVQRNFCVGVEVFESTDRLTPGQCRGYNSVRTPSGGDARIFWANVPNSTQFIIFWNGQEIARCDSGAGSCAVFLPPA